MIKVAEFYKEIRAGSSLPLIVGGSDGHKYVVKLHGSGDGVLANIVEFLSLKLGRLAQIPVLEPALVVIEKNFDKKAGDPEIKELLTRSVGINLATKYIEGVSIYHEQSPPVIDAELKNNIFLYDLFLLNITKETKSSISKRLIEEKNNAAALLKRLDMLRILQRETEEERRLRTLRNKQAFEKKFRKL